MLTKRLGIVTALFVLAIAAACSGGGSNPTPVYPNPSQNTTGQVITLTPTSGFSGNFTVAGTNPTTTSAPANLSATLSTTAPSGVPVLSKDVRTAQAAVSPVPQAYITITAGTGGALITSISSLEFTLPAAVPAGESLYIAYYNGTIWKTLGAAGTLVAGSTATYTLAGGAISPNITLAAGGQLYLGLYEGTYSVPTPSPSPTPSATPTPFPNAVTNGNFETGSLAPWVACSYQHQGYAAPVSPSPAPAATASQPPNSTGSPSPVISGSTLAPYVSITSPPNNFNPNQTANTPTNLGSYAALTGNLAAQINSATGICQTVTIPLSGSLSFWVYEGGTGYNFYNGDQEAQILDSTGTTIEKTLFVELNCYYDSTNFPSEPVYASSGCFPTAYGGTSTFVDWQGGFWTERGPYDLSALAGQTVTLFIGVWTDQTHQPAPLSYAQYMFVDNVALTGTGIAPSPTASPSPSPSPSPAPTATVPVTIQGAQR